MVGQKNNLMKMKTLVEQNKVPHFIIVSGPELSGKGTLIKEFCEIIDKNANIVNIIANMESMRNMIDDVPIEKTIYIIENFESLRIDAQNSVLKLFEEPRDNCYYIISTINEDIMLPTILSRGQIFRMEHYSLAELKVFAENNIASEFLFTICESPSEIIYWKNRDIEAFKQFIDNFYKDLTTKSIPYSINDLTNIGYKVEQVEPYYLYFIRSLSNKIVRTYNWKTRYQYVAFMKLVDDLYKSTKYVGVRKESLMEIFIINLHNLLNK